MKRVLWTVTVVLIAGNIYAQQDSTNRSSRTEPGATIILPDVQLTIQDESSIPLLERENNLLNDDILNVSQVNLEEFVASEVSERIRSQFFEEPVRGNFSLSSFMLSYGRYEDLLIDINLGKSIESLNYLISYLRNKRKSIGFETNDYYNTERQLDDLKLDFLYTAGEKLDLDFSLGYYDQSLNLFTNTVNQTEFKMNVPLEFKTIYNLNMNSRLIGSIGYQYLQLDHKLFSSVYDRQIFSEFRFEGDYEGDYSRDNSLKASVLYNYAYRAGSNLHDVSLQLLDKFPIVEALSMEAGAGVTFYNYKTIFWYPKAFLYYKYSNVFSFELGIEGKNETYDIGKILKDDQIFWTNCNPDEYWDAKAAVSISPAKVLTFRVEALYKDYFNYLNYSYDTARQLYRPVSETNISILSLKAGFEMLVKENFSVHAEYEYKYCAMTNLLFFSPHNASVSLKYNNDAAGFQFQTSAAYKHYQFLSDAFIAAPYVDWSAQVSKTLTKEIIVELKFDNILNQSILDRLHVPESGLSYHLGVKILL